MNDKQTETWIEKKTDKTIQNMFNLTEKSYGKVFSFVNGNAYDYKIHICAVYINIYIDNYKMISRLSP